MEGVIILNTAQVYSDLQIIGMVFGTLGMVVISVYFLMWIIDYIFYDWVGIALSVALFVVGIIGLCLIPPSETYYEVIVDDSVSMTEFNEEYEIIEQRGMIYKVKERE